MEPCKNVSPYLLAAIVLALCASAQAKNHPVADSDGLQRALNRAQPGDVIELSAGTYDGTQVSGREFRIRRSGKRGEPITLRGPAGAVLGNSRGYGLHIENAAYWRIDGFTVSGAKKGIVLDGASHIQLESLTLRNIGQEAVHFRRSSQDNVLTNSVIYNTGRSDPQFGEAVYVGSAKSNWATQMGSRSRPDRTRNTCIARNTLGPNVTAEAIDIKEGSSYTYVMQNDIDLSGISGRNYTDSAVDAKGEYIYVYGNTIENRRRTYLAKVTTLDGDIVASKKVPDAIQSHQIDNPADVPSGTRIWAWGNSVDLASAGAPRGYSRGMLLRAEGKGDIHYCTSPEGNRVARGDIGSNLNPSSCSAATADIGTACPPVLDQ